ncbi:MAG: alpha/beta fold hydrolase [Dehalococcoidia bacterium]
MTAPADTDTTVRPTIAEQVQAEVDRAIRRGALHVPPITLSDQSVGVTAKDVVYSVGTTRLYHYRPRVDEVYRVPVLVVTSLVSKPYILDLTPGQSLVEFLLDRGFDVFLVDWGVPRHEDRTLRLEDYVLERIPACVERVHEITGEPDVTILGYCLGGTLSAMYGAAFTDAPVRNWAFLTTPVDFTRMGMFSTWSDRRYFDVDRVVDTLGNVPGELIFMSFDMLKPAGRVAGQLRLIERARDDKFVRAFMLVDRWAADQIPFPGECFRQITKELFWENKLLRGELELGGRRIDLKAITQPMLHITAEHDHIVPAAASVDLSSAVGSTDCEDVVLRGGHASLVAGGNAKYRLWPQLERWLATRSV